MGGVYSVVKHLTRLSSGLTFYNDKSSLHGFAKFLHQDTTASNKSDDKLKYLVHLI